MMASISRVIFATYLVTVEGGGSHPGRRRRWDNVGDPLYGED